MASEPYASVILPVHGRSLSLFASLHTVCNQNVENIEIIVAGDGAVDEVIETVTAFTARDARIRFLNRGKAPGRGERNRDYAVRSARSERIFYIDDDDLWLPDHIKTLGPGLDRVDVVNTPIWSVHPSGALATIPGNYGSATLRGLLAHRKLKLVHDTHLAHRKSAYMRLADGGWVEDPEMRPVLRLLSQFAEDESIVWSTVPSLTALSFSSPPRWQYTAAQRLVELMEWLARIQMLRPPASLAGNASLASALLEIAFRVPPSDTEGLFEYLARFDIRVVTKEHERETGSKGIGEQLALTLTTKQIRDADAVLKLIQGNTEKNDAVVEVLLDVAESPHGRNSMTWHVCNLLAESLGLDDSIAVTQQIRTQSPRRKALQCLLLAQLYFRKGNHRKALLNLDRGWDWCHDFPFEYRALRKAIPLAE